MITAALIGDRAMVARLQALPARLKAEVDRTVRALGLELQARVQRDYLTGQVLKVRTGRLRSSIAQGQPDSRSHFEANADSAWSFVGTNVSYGRIWELTGRGAQTIVPVHAKALRFTVNGHVVFAKKVNQKAQAARPFLAPALKAITPFARQQLQIALTRAAQAGLKA